MFGNFFKKKRLPPQKAPPLSGGTAFSILSVAGSQSIPTLPPLAQKAFQISVDPNADTEDFIKIIESDESLSARVLKISNSVYYDRGHPSKTIGEAVNTIGLKELRCLLNANVLKELFPSQSSLRVQFWRNDIATGIISKELAGRYLRREEELAFVSGLMHDIGKLLLIQRVEPSYKKVIEIVMSTGCSFQKAETDVFPFDHTEAGQLIAEKWHFSQEIIDVIRTHHAPWSTFDQNHITLPQIVKAADTIAHVLGLGHPSGYGKFQTETEAEFTEMLTHFKIDHATRSELLQRMKKKYEEEQDRYAGLTQDP